MKSLSLKAGLSESAVRDMLTRGRSPSVENFVSIAETLGVSPNWLLQGDERFRLSIPSIGASASGETWVAKPSKTGNAQFDLDVANADMISLRIEDDSMSPIYRAGDELFCRRIAGTYFDNLVGADCVVETIDGKRFIKILAKGNKPSHYTLRSFNPTVKDIENVRLTWAAPIIMIKRASAW